MPPINLSSGRGASELRARDSALLLLLRAPEASDPEASAARAQVKRKSWKHVRPLDVIRVRKQRQH